MSNKKEIQSIIVIVLGMLILFVIFRSNLFLILALTIACLGFIPYPRKLIVALWFRLAEVLGFINSRILLGLVFFLILFPMAMLSRLFSKDKLQLKRKSPKDATYYQNRNHKYGSEDFENPW